METYTFLFIFLFIYCDTEPLLNGLHVARSKGNTETLKPQKKD